MSDEVLTRMFTKTFSKMKDEEFECHLETIDYFWEHWDELVKKQMEYVKEHCKPLPVSHSGEYIYPTFVNSFSDILPEKLYDVISWDHIKRLNDLLWTCKAYRKCPGKEFKKQTRTHLIERYFVHIFSNFR